MTINPSDRWLICLLSTFVLMSVAGYCATDDIGFLPFAIICGGCLVGIVDIATLFWPTRS